MHGGRFGVSGLSDSGNAPPTITIGRRNPIFYKVTLEYNMVLGTDNIDAVARDWTEHGC